jgi:Phage integrase family
MTGQRGRTPAPKPDPFTEEDRDKIIQAFKEKNRFYYPLVYLLFWTGMRPSEALALRWEDIDIKHGFLSISKSRYMDAENSPKTAGSEREKYIGGDVEEQFSRLSRGKTETFTETHVEATGTDPDEVVENYEKEVGGPTWTRTRDQPVMSRWL